MRKPDEKEQQAFWQINLQGGLRAMAITRVWIEEGCISCGLSESNCPEVFKVETGEPSQVIEGVDYSGLEEKIKIAAESCPVEVIKYDEEWYDYIKNI